MNDKLKKDHFYEVMDRIPYEERKRLNLPEKSDEGVQKLYAPMPSLGTGVPGVHAVWTGEKRCPKKGEWYLSGAIIEAYRAPNDLSTPFHIARLVRTKKEHKTIITAIEQESLVGKKVKRGTFSPDSMAANLSVNTAYEVEWVHPSGKLLVLKNFLGLVHVDDIEVVE